MNLFNGCWPCFEEGVIVGVVLVVVVVVVVVAVVVVVPSPTRKGVVFIETPVLLRSWSFFFLPVPWKIGK